MSSVGELLKQFKKTHGERVGDYDLFDPLSNNKIPTGIFALDMILNGGIPRGHTTQIYAKEGSGKTNLALKLISNYQRVYTQDTCIFFDMERTYDKKWAMRLGVDTSKLIVIRPDFAEQLVDMMDEVLVADDAGLIVVDSIGCIMTGKEFTDEASKVKVGGNAGIIKRLCVKITVAYNKAYREERFPTVLFLNQITVNVGQMFGNPESYPGGKALRHHLYLNIKLYGKDGFDKAENPDIAIFKETNVTLEKYKMQVTSKNCQYSMVMQNHSQLQIGEVDDWNIIEKYAREYNILTKEKEGWAIDGDIMAKLIDWRDLYRTNKQWSAWIKEVVLTKHIDFEEEKEQAIIDKLEAAQDVKTTTV